MNPASDEPVKRHRLAGNPVGAGLMRDVIECFYHFERDPTVSNYPDIAPLT